MPRVALAPVTRADATELVQGNLDSREHHQPWTASFTDKVGAAALVGIKVTTLRRALKGIEAVSGDGQVSVI